MTLTPATRLGVYEVTAQIGEGGMGHVYRASDTKLNRDVALKMLPEAFASDLDRLAQLTLRSPDPRLTESFNASPTFTVSKNPMASVRW